LFSFYLSLTPAFVVESTTLQETLMKIGSIEDFLQGTTFEGKTMFDCMCLLSFYQTRFKRSTEIPG
jgi:hypothetical protein